MTFINRIKRIDNSPTYQYGLLVAITSLAILLRFYKLGQWSFWIDEIRTVNRVEAHYSSIEAILQNIPPAINWLPLSLILTGGALNIRDINEWSARLIPALIGVLTIPVFFVLVKHVYGTYVGLVSALLLAVSPWHLYWSQNARSYTSLMLFYTLALFALYFGIERDRSGYVFLFLVLTYLAVSERLVGLLIIPVVFLYLLLLKVLPFDPPPGLRKRNLLLLVSPLILLVLYQVYTLLGNQQSLISDIFSEVNNAFVGTSIENPFAQTTFIVFNIGIPLISVAFFSGLYLILKKNQAGLLFFLGAIVPLVIVILVTPFMFTEERYAFVTLPCWIILAAVGVKEIFVRVKSYEKLLAVGILTLLIMDAAGDNLMYFKVNNGNRRDWKGAFARVEDRSREGDIYVSTWPELGLYYTGREMKSWRDVNPDEIKNSDKRVWFVIVPDMAWVWKNEDFLWWVKNNGELVDILYLRQPDDANVTIYLYDPTRISFTETPRS